MSNSTLIKCMLSAAIVCAASANVASAHDYDGRSYGWHPVPPPVRHVVRNYNYVYYPSHQVYYAPAERNWYWANGGGWSTGSSLPYGFNLDMRVGGVPIVLSSPRPYVEHVYVEQRYGRPWRDSHRWQAERRYEHQWREERHEHYHGWGR